MVVLSAVHPDGFGFSSQVKSDGGPHRKRRFSFSSQQETAAQRRQLLQVRKEVERRGGSSHSADFLPPANAPSLTKPLSSCCLPAPQPIQKPEPLAGVVEDGAAPLLLTPVADLLPPKFPSSATLLAVLSTFIQALWLSLSSLRCPAHSGVFLC